MTITGSIYTLPANWTISIVTSSTLTNRAITGILPIIISISATEHTEYSGTDLGTTTIAADALGYVAASTVMNLLFAHFPTALFLHSLQFPCSFPPAHRC
ncbi:MAG: hypothetical protein WC959_02500 [Kiritimatiellales bacterium]